MDTSYNLDSGNLCLEKTGVVVEDTDCLDIPADLLLSLLLDVLVLLQLILVEFLCSDIIGIESQHFLCDFNSELCVQGIEKPVVE